MNRRDLYLVVEALKSAATELQALEDENIHVPSGDLLGQIQEAMEIAEAAYAKI